ncbi:hypothetical protein [Sphingomonas arenae]|uniref:hypothetical protein n=1 Tax=Sphingomonas arenae TaxID=2812555 RepID=UPI0019678E95|nr:hypothetical protein [Sphingomonas arenae]
MGEYRQVSIHKLVAAAALALFPAMPAAATPASGFTAVQQWKGTFPELMLKADKEQVRSDKWDLMLKTTGTTDLWVVRNAVAVGGQSGWHMHPGPSLITVTVGSITAYDSDDPLCSPKVYSAGQTFLDSGAHAHLLKNESGAAAETVAVQFLPEGAGRRIDAPQPNNCKF